MSRKKKSGLPKELEQDLMQILSAELEEVSPLEELDDLSDLESQEIDEVAGRSEREGVPGVNMVESDPEDGVLPGPDNGKYKTVQHAGNLVTRTFDLAQPADAEEYSKEIEKIQDPRTTRILAAQMAPPLILLDANSAQGYRAIVVLVTADVVQSAVVRAEYAIIERAKLKRTIPEPEPVDDDRPRGDTPWEDNKSF